MRQPPWNAALTGSLPPFHSSECSGRRASSTIEAVAVPAPATARRGRGPLRVRLGGSRRPARLRAVNHGPRHRRTPSELYGCEMVAKAIVGSPMRRARTSPRDPAFTNQRLQKPEGAGAREGPPPFLSSAPPPLGARLRSPTVRWFRADQERRAAVQTAQAFTRQGGTRTSTWAFPPCNPTTAVLPLRR
jgi:hypothetical protein